MAGVVTLDVDADGDPHGDVDADPHGDMDEALHGDADEDGDVDADVDAARLPRVNDSSHSVIQMNANCSCSWSMALSRRLYSFIICKS